VDYPSDKPTSPRRRWVAVGVATAIGVFSYFSLIQAFVASTEDLGQDVVAPSFFFGMATVPLAFIALAFISRNPSAPMAVLKAMGLFVLVGLPVGLLVPVLGVVAGFGAGAVVALRRDEDQNLTARIVAVLSAVIYTLLVMLIAVPLGVFTGAFVPFVAVGFGDQYSERKAEELRRTAAEG